MSQTEQYHITGYSLTEKGNTAKSHHHSFKAGKPHLYPLFKLHKLNLDQINNKVIPPARFVLSMKASPTSKVGLFLADTLKSVAENYCGASYLKDTNSFLRKLNDNSSLLAGPNNDLFSIDVKALYPSIKPHYVPIAVRDALNKCTDWSEERIDAIIELVEFSIKHAAIHFRNKWYLVILGLPTGGADSVVLANIVVQWVFINFFATDEGIKWYKFLLLLSRFIDGVWFGSRLEFDEFLTSLNNFGIDFGIFFDDGDVQFGKEIHFLDVVVSITDNILHTSLYSKPTDAHRFLHRLSFHPPHTFRSLPFAQMRRAALICSEMEERERSIDDMIKYFRGCGYKEYSLIAAQNRAMELSRQDLLGYTRPVRDEIPLVFVTTYCKEIPLLKNIFKNYQDDIYRLTDKSNVIVACRKNANTSALLFNKFGFCQSILESEAVNQKCGDGRCSTCPLMFETLEPIILNEHNLTLKLSNKYNCKSEDIIYFVQCKVPGCGDFYFGQTTNRLHIRFNNHR